MICSCLTVWLTQCLTGIVRRFENTFFIIQNVTASVAKKWFPTNPQSSTLGKIRHLWRFDMSGKSYDELKARLDAVLSGTVSTAKTAAAMVEEDTVDFTPPVSTPTPEPQTAPFSATNDDDDDAMSYFEKLANE